jgi:uncharacterized protein (DUF427 family)
MPASPAPDPVLDGQESVWDYPRPPAVRPCSRSIEVSFGGHVVCRTTSSLQVLETSHPPVYYLPRSTFTAGALRPARGASLCEWKGAAAYLDIVAGGRVASAAAWYYPNPSPGFEALAGHVAVYAGRVDGCFVDGRRVQPQPGGFYGGWITPDVAGPFKGAPGTSGW